MAQFSPAHSAVYAQLANLSQVRAMPDIDIDIPESLKEQITVAVTELELPDGQIIQTTIPDNLLRYVVYDNQIQQVRKVESFVDYHTKNPGSLKRMMRNAYWVLLHDEHFIETMYQKSKSNDNGLRPMYEARDAMTGFQPGQVYWYGNTKRIPISTLVKHTLNWLKGLAISSYGLEALDLIKEAEAEGHQKRYNEVMKQHKEVVKERDLDGLDSDS